MVAHLPRSPQISRNANYEREIGDLNGRQFTLQIRLGIQLTSKKCKFLAKEDNQ